MFERESRERGYGWPLQSRWLQPRRTSTYEWSRSRQGNSQWSRQQWQRHAPSGGYYRNPGNQWQRRASRRFQRPHHSPRQWKDFEHSSGRFHVQRKQRPGYGSGSHEHQKQQGLSSVSGSGKDNMQKQSRDQQKSNLRGMSFSVFVDGLSDRVTLLKLKMIFGKVGKVTDVFIQFKKKFQRRFRYGFVRFQSDEEAWQAIRTLNGKRVEGNHLSVQKARFKQSTWGGEVPLQTQKQNSKIQVQEKVWRPKKNQQATGKNGEAKKQEASAQPYEAARSSAECRLNIVASELDNAWYHRCARARTLEAKPVDVIQDELAQIGMYNFRFIPLGANEVLLEFENNEEMVDTLVECSFFLEQKLTELRPCTRFTFGVAHLVWIRLWQVPMGLWSDSFFTAVGNRLGKFVSLDVATKQRHRADFARVLVQMHHPLLQCFTMAVDVEGTACVILVEKDDLAYDYGKVETMPSTPVKEYNSEDATDFGDDSENNEDMLFDETRGPVYDIEKDYESAIDVESDDEDEVFRDEKLEGLQFVVEVEDQQPEAPVLPEEGTSAGGGESLANQSMATKPVVAPDLGAERLEEPLPGEPFSNLNLVTIKAVNDGVNFGEQLRVLQETGYTADEIEEWRRNITAEGIQNQISNYVFQNSDLIYNKKTSVTGYSFNTQDLAQKYSWPLYSTYWDPHHVLQQQLLRPCLPKCFYDKNDLLRFATSLLPSLASAVHVNNTASRESYYRTSPYQIVRQSTPAASVLPQVNHVISPQEPETPLQELQLVPADFATPTPYNSPNTNSSKKNSQRGRPKGSKNKPIPLPHDFLEPVTGEDGVSTRAQRAWLIGKQLGLKPRGSEALMLRGLEAQIRENHPHLN